MIIADFHTHTRFSTDSETKPEAMIERAIALGLTKYCITDHMDYLYPHGASSNFTFDIK
jgi:histidinol-phosphatase (PHP family)